MITNKPKVKFLASFFKSIGSDDAEGREWERDLWESSAKSFKFFPSGLVIADSTDYCIVDYDDEVPPQKVEKMASAFSAKWKKRGFKVITLGDYPSIRKWNMGYRGNPMGQVAYKGINPSPKFARVILDFIQSHGGS